MARYVKNTVDYFPHSVHSGKTMYILEKQFQNDGYAFWFKILELLGSFENHYIDCRKEDDWQYFLAKVNVTENIAIQILELLSKLGSIDKELWSQKIIWSQNFINNIVDVYARRKDKCMNKYDLCKHLLIKCIQKTTKETIVNKTKEKKSIEYPFSSQKFIDAYNDFKEMREKIKKPLTERAEELILKKLSEQKEDIAIIMLEKSITNCWQDVFVPKENKNNNGLTAVQYPNEVKYKTEKEIDILKLKHLIRKEKDGGYIYIG